VQVACEKISLQSINNSRDRSIDSVDSINAVYCYLSSEATSNKPSNAIPNNLSSTIFILHPPSLLTGKLEQERKEKVANGSAGDEEEEEETDKDSNNDKDEDDYGPAPAAGIWAGSQKLQRGSEHMLNQSGDNKDASMYQKAYMKSASRFGKIDKSSKKKVCRLRKKHVMNGCA
jgi:hypothetical protein